MNVLDIDANVAAHAELMTAFEDDGLPNPLPYGSKGPMGWDWLDVRIPFADLVDFCDWFKTNTLHLGQMTNTCQQTISAVVYGPTNVIMFTKLRWGGEYGSWQEAYDWD